jgi:hypothetical protein
MEVLHVCSRERKVKDVNVKHFSNMKEAAVSLQKASQMLVQVSS